MKKIAILTATLALCSLAGPPLVQAADISSLIQNLSGNLGSWSDFDTRKTSLIQAIDTAAVSGQLTSNQANAFKQQIAALSEAEVKAKTGRGRFMSFVDAMSFNNQLNAIAAQAQSVMNSGIATLPDIDRLQVELNHRIETNITSGKFSAPDATALKAELANVARIEAAFKAETGAGLTPRQIEVLSIEINKVKAKIEEQERIADSAIPALNGRRQALDAKIMQAQQAGRIRNQERANFVAQLHANASRQQTYQSGNSGLLTGVQVLTLARELDTINNSLEMRLEQLPSASAPPVTTLPVVSTAELDRRMQQAENRLRRMVRTNTLSQADIDELHNQFDQISRMRASYLVSAGGMTQVEVDDLNNGLNRLTRKIDRQLEIAATTNRNDQVSNEDTQPGNSMGESTNTSVNTNTTTTTTASVPTRTFADLQGYWGQPYVETLAGSGVIGGFPNGTFRPNDNITRAQFAAIAVQALKLPDNGGTNNFVDVKPSHWAARAIGSASTAGLITGFPDGSFKPEDQLTRAQALVILSKALMGKVSPSTNMLNAYKDAEAVPAWASESLARAANARIIVNFPDAAQIRPNALCTRGEVAAMTYQTLAQLNGNLPRLSIGILSRASASNY